MGFRVPGGKFAASAAALFAVLAAAPGTALADSGPASIPATPPQHFINFTYGVPGDFDEYKYSIKVDTDVHTDDIYYAQYVYGPGGTGYYSGLQPHTNGLAGVRFSYFGAGATPVGSTCRKGADSGGGVTCAIDDLKYVQGRQYTFITKKSKDAQDTTYTGTITDNSTGQTRTVGAWRLPASFTKFDGSADAFIEKFSGIKSCADIPPVHVSYSNVTADGKPVSFASKTHTASDKPGTGIYTCSNVSDYTVSAPTPGSYSVTSTS